MTIYIVYFNGGCEQAFEVEQDAKDYLKDLEEEFPFYDIVIEAVWFYPKGSS